MRVGTGKSITLQWKTMHLGILGSTQIGLEGCKEMKRKGECGLVKGYVGMGG